MIIIKAATETTKKMVTEFSPGPVATSTKETMNSICETVTARCSGKMEVTTKEIGRMESNMVKVNIFLFKVKYLFLLKVIKKVDLIIIKLFKFGNNNLFKNMV